MNDVRHHPLFAVGSIPMTSLQWHQTAARAQALSKSSLSLLHHPETRSQAVVDAQAMLDHLLGMGFKGNRPSKVEI